MINLIENVTDANGSTAIAASNSDTLFRGFNEIYFKLRRFHVVLDCAGAIHGFGFTFFAYHDRSNNSRSVGVARGVVAFLSDPYSALHPCHSRKAW